MVTKLKEIVSENPVTQIWKYLRLFQDIDYTSEIHRSYMKIPKENKAIRSNIKKQATQIGYCLRQAEEYFQASQTVNLPTRPLLLYYGAVSLSQALVLLKSDGRYAFDAISDKYKSHGLDLTLSVRDDTFSNPKLFFDAIKPRHQTNGFFRCSTTY